MQIFSLAPLETRISVPNLFYGFGLEDVGRERRCLWRCSPSKSRGRLRPTIDQCGRHTGPGCATRASAAGKAGLERHQGWPVRRTLFSLKSVGRNKGAVCARLRACRAAGVFERGDGSGHRLLAYWDLRHPEPCAPDEWRKVHAKLGRAGPRRTAIGTSTRIG